MRREKAPSAPSSSSNGVPTSASRRRGPHRAPQSTPGKSSVLLATAGCVLLLMVLAPVLFYMSTSTSQPQSLRDRVSSRHLNKQGAEDQDRPAAAAAIVPVNRPEPDHTPVVVLSTGNGKWNTGVWTGFGEERPTLNWAAAGVVVDKSECPHKCEFTHDQSRIPDADAVLMELVNHPKFLGMRTKEPIPWPARRETRRANDVKFPLVGNFYMEPPNAYPQYTGLNAALKEHVDFTVGPDRATSDFPITLTCPWGKPRSEYLKPPGQKAPGNFMLYLNEHGVAADYRDYVNEVAKLLGPEQFHAYKHMANRKLPEDAANNLAKRLEFMSTYKFALVTEPQLLTDWIEPDWSQTLIAGVIPVYIGAPNIIEYTPGRRSFIDIRDFPTAADLVARLRQVASDQSLYNDFFAWKRDGLSPQFETALDNCAHYGECRICGHVRDRIIDQMERDEKAAEIASFS